jgi:Cdc6-like AAA superfamily ATPase
MRTLLRKLKITTLIRVHVHASLERTHIGYDDHLRDWFAAKEKHLPLKQYIHIILLEDINKLVDDESTNLIYRILESLRKEKKKREHEAQQKKAVQMFFT